MIEPHHDFLPLAICSGIRIFFVVSFVFISSDFSSGALWQNVLPQDFATNSFVRISLGFRQNLN